MALETGKYISTDLSEYIKLWVSNPELKEIAKQNDLSYELARLISSSDRKLTEENMPLMKDILQRAIDNRNGKEAILKKTHNKAVKLLSKSA